MTSLKVSYDVTQINMAEGETLSGVQKIKKDCGQYLLVDCGEQLLKDVEEMRDELHKQALSLKAQQKLLWEVVKSLIILILPVTGALCLLVIANQLLPSPLLNSVSILLLTTTSGFVVLNLPPLNNAVKAYLGFTVYTPKFGACKCDKCGEEEQLKPGDDVARDTVSIIKDTAALHSDKVLVMQSDASEIKADKVPVAKKAADDIGVVERPEIKFPVPYRRNIALNASTNATTKQEMSAEIHVSPFDKVAGKQYRPVKLVTDIKPELGGEMFNNNIIAASQSLKVTAGEEPGSDAPEVGESVQDVSVD